jgi:hypothetical protein
MDQLAIGLKTMVEVAMVETAEQVGMAGMAGMEELVRRAQALPSQIQDPSLAGEEVVAARGAMVAMAVLGEWEPTRVFGVTQLVFRLPAVGEAMEAMEATVAMVELAYQVPH